MDMVGNRRSIRCVMQVHGDVVTGGNQLGGIQRSIVCRDISRKKTVLYTAAGLQDCRGIGGSWSLERATASECGAFIGNRRAFLIPLPVSPNRNEIASRRIMRHVADADVMRDFWMIRLNLDGG